MRKFITFVIIVCTYSISAQINFYPFGFARSQNIPILNSNNIPLQFPWIGGINSVVFSSIDLNNDGIKDLVGFEKHGNRILPFVWNSQSSQYEFAPQFSQNFPILHDWVILKDYDNDGKEDIFIRQDCLVIGDNLDLEGLHNPAIIAEVDVRRSGHSRD